MFLLDTMVLSELRKKDRNPGLVRWIGQQKDRDLFVSVVSIGEIERGICRQQARDAAFAQKLAAWLDQLLLSHADRILPVTIPIARRWGQLGAELGRSAAALAVAVQGMGTKADSCGTVNLSRSAGRVCRNDGFAACRSGVGVHAGKANFASDADRQSC